MLAFFKKKPDPSRMTDADTKLLLKGLAAVPVIAALGIVEFGMTLGITPFVMVAAITEEMTASVAILAKRMTTGMIDVIRDPEAAWKSYKQRREAEQQYDRAFRRVCNEGLMHIDGSGWLIADETARWQSVKGDTAKTAALAAFGRAEKEMQQFGLLEESLQAERNVIEELHQNPIRRRIQELLATVGGASVMLALKTGAVQSIPSEHDYIEMLQRIRAKNPENEEITNALTTIYKTFTTVENSGLVAPLELREAVKESEGSTTTTADELKSALLSARPSVVRPKAKTL